MGAGEVEPKTEAVEAEGEEKGDFEPDFWVQPLNGFRSR